MVTIPKDMNEVDPGPIHTYAVDLAASTFAHDAAEYHALRECAAELLRCCVDRGSDFSAFGATIEETACMLDCSLFVTLLARMEAQNVMNELGEIFENTRQGLLEAALRLDQFIS